MCVLIVCFGGVAGDTCFGCVALDEWLWMRAIDAQSDGSSESGLDIDPDICNLPIDTGDCEDKSLASHENGLSDNAIKEIYAINDLYEVTELYEINDRYKIKKLDRLSQELHDHNAHRDRYFGYNKNTMNCEEFDYDGCGGNDNRFKSLKKCRSACFTPLKYFLSEVADLILLKFTEYSSEEPAT
ncbi:hypothetical protein PYW07_011786 [Mythimna separata]|uniref:BPTI/Kunitz inhibitor domain-containing protein n=1 Tax=Mythimna separata TaxID=271217 RepID=A0AAD7Y6Z2_MYTSE|nr:hypothetical protein PYW07_011786 [Mythimna separata]